MNFAFISLKILLPFRVFDEMKDVKRLILETPAGSCGYLPNRLDCTSALVPGILFYESQSKGEVFLAVDEGVMVKSGKDVLVSVRNAIGGADLGKLHRATEEEFLNLDIQEREFREMLAKMESNFIRQFTKLKNE